MSNDREQQKKSISRNTDSIQPATDQSPKKPEEIGGPKGPEPTRYGDWEKAGRCIDF